MKRITWIALVSFALVGTTQAASFDCSKAASTVEKLICGDSELSKLDEELSVQYQQALDRNTDKQSITKEEIQWLRNVRGMCQTVACLKSVYQDRIKFERNSLCNPESSCDKMTLMYSEDDRICKPLLNIYQQFWTKRKEARSWQEHYWEDASPNVFRTAGFIKPKSFQDALHNFVPTSRSLSGEWAIEFYKFKFDQTPEPQTVLLRDSPFHGHGAYNSNVYISKPGEDISNACGEDSLTSNGASPDTDGDNCAELHKHFAFATDFKWDSEIEIGADNLISREYDFEKSNTSENFARVMHGELLSLKIGISDGTIQRVYLFDNQPIFVAREDGTILAYRIKNGSQMDDVCYIASNVARVARTEPSTQMHQKKRSKTLENPN